MQVPRKDNSAADAAANWALDTGSFLDVRVDETNAFLQKLGHTPETNIGLMCSFDGAARGNPGPASSGVCLWWGTFDSNCFHPCGLLIQRGVRLGTGTNNSAEAHGLATALRTALHLFFG